VHAGRAEPLVVSANNGEVGPEPAAQHRIDVGVDQAAPIARRGADVRDAAGAVRVGEHRPAARRGLALGQRDRAGDRDLPPARVNRAVEDQLVARGRREGRGAV
jgi:hypothetical protein